jgi:hypothetical protein
VGNFPTLNLTEAVRNNVQQVNIKSTQKLVEANTHSQEAVMLIHTCCGMLKRKLHHVRESGNELLTLKYNHILKESSINPDLEYKLSRWQVQ